MTFRLNSWAKLGLVMAVSTIASQAALAATTATIDLNTQKFIGGVSDLDRSKYFNIHMTATESQVTVAELEFITKELNAGFGRQFWSPFSAHSGDAPYPSEASAITNGANSITYANNHANAAYASNRVMVTDHPKNVYVHGEDPLLAAEWAANYFKHYYDNANRPMFYEPMNEPYVHAGDFGTDQAAIRLGMANVFKEIGKKFDQENIATQIIGYSSAWPSMELWDFGHFNGRMKQFMDVAGPHVDSFSIHPYDGVNVTGANNERSGSNLESLLDLIETYSSFKWNTVKPITISEYGGIESGYGDTYTDLRSAQSLLSQNKMLMQLLDRQDRLLTTIPFNTGKAAWHYNAANNWNPYGATILRPDPTSIVDGKPTNFFWTKRADIYRLWSDVQGSRVKVETTNPDIQVNAFVNGNKAYVALNSLAEAWETVDLDFVNSLGTITNVRQKLLVVRQSTEPTYTDTTITAPASYAMEPGTTVVWEYTFAAPVGFDGTLDTKHHYAPEHLVNIIANQNNIFSFNGVTAQNGKSVIRMSLGRAHGASLAPTVLLNGTAVNVNLNWKGGNQATRDSFFGAIEIPVDNALLQVNNVVTVTFPDAGGQIASMVLQVNNDSTATSIPDTTGFANTITTLPSGSSYDVVVDYTAGESRDIAVEFWQNNSWLGQKTVTVAAGSGQKTITVPSNKATLAGEMGYAFKVSIRPVGGGWQTAFAYKSMTGINIQDTVVPTMDNFAFSTVVTELPSEATHTFAIDYDATLERDLVVEMWQDNAWLAQNKVTVQPGIGTANVTVTLSSPLVSGSTGYILKGSLRPVGGDWTTNVETANQFGISVVGITPPTTYTPLTFKSSAKCLDVTAGGTANGVQLQQYTCYANNNNQSFLFEDLGAGYWSIKNATSAKCIDKTNSTADGAIIHQWDCSATNDNQSFKFVDQGAGYFQLQNKHSGKCLDLVGGINGTVNSTQITQSTCGASDSQKLKF